MGVSILPPGRSSWDVIGSQIGQNLSNVLPGAVQQGYNRGQLQSSLEEIKNISQQQGAKPIDLILSAMKAGAGIPGSERYLGQLIPILQQMGLANASQNAPIAGEKLSNTQQIPRNREPLERSFQPQEFPGFLGQQGQQNFPTNIGPQGGPGVAPQTATTRQKQPLLTREEKIPAARALAKERNDAGIPTTVQEALKEVNEAEKDKKLYNTEIDKELEQQVSSQEKFGDIGVNYLKGEYPEATAEMKAIFQKKGEEASKRGDSIADVNRYLAKEAEKFKNRLANVSLDLDAPRLQNSFQRALQGTYKNLEQAGADARRHLQPILDLGLYDTARKMLAKKNFGLEEREAIIHPLNPQSNSILSQIPKIETKKSLGKAPGHPGLGISFEREKPDLETVKSVLQQLKQSDPNFSLVLARKAFEDKGYTWREFKDALNQMEEQGFKLEDDQDIQRGYLDTPPLNLLERILHGVNIIGR